MYNILNNIHDCHVVLIGGEECHFNVILCRKMKYSAICVMLTVFVMFNKRAAVFYQV